MRTEVGGSDFNWIDFYKMGVSIVGPRPIAWVSSLSADGIANVAPYSFFNMVSANPPVLMFAPTVRRTRDHKDTLSNIQATKEFVVGVVTEDNAGAMVQTSGDYPADVDEFEAVGLTKLDASKVKPALIGESPINFECVLDQVISYGSDPGCGQMVLGKVVALHVDDAMLAEDGLVDPTKLRTVGRLGRNTYARTTDLFDIPRPKV